MAGGIVPSPDWGKGRGAPNTTPLDPPFFEGENSPVARYPADCPEAGNEKSAKPNDMKIGPLAGIPDVLPIGFSAVMVRDNWRNGTAIWQLKG